MTEKTAYNRRLAKKRVQCLNETLCFVSSSVLADSLVLRNPLLRQAPKRYTTFYTQIMAQEYTFEDFIYQLDEKFNHIVKTNPPRENPEVVYKYYSISKNSLSALQNLRLYATHPYSFNDSVDSSELILNFKEITKERFDNFHKQMLTSTEFDKLDLTQLFEDDKKRNFYNFRNFTYNFFTRNIGLISLTTMPFNILMWSHYTNESGFVIEFNTESLINDIHFKNKDITNYCFRPVQYLKNIEFINMFAEQFSTPDIPLLYSTNIKRKEWEYEDEWRLGIYKKDMGIPLSSLYPGNTDYQGKDNRFFNYSRDSIESISLGKHFFSGNNCEKVSNDNGVIFTLKERNEEQYKDSDKNFIEFVTHLYENYNDKLYMSGEYEENNKLKRSLGQISLKKIDNKTFKIIDLKRVVIKD